MTPKPLLVSRMYNHSILKHSLIKLILNLDCLIPYKFYQKIYCKQLYLYKYGLLPFLTDQNSVVILQYANQFISYTLNYSYQLNGGIALKYHKMGKISGE